MEARTVPSTVAWAGPASGGDWDTAAYWSTNALPGSGDDVVIPAHISLGHSQSNADAINSLTTGSGDSLSASSGSLTISAHSAIDSSFTLSILSARVSFNAAVPETVTLASLSVGNNSTLSGTDNFIVTGQFSAGGQFSGQQAATHLIGPAGSFLTAQGGMVLGGLGLDGRKLINPAGQTATFTGGIVDMFHQVIFDNEGAMLVTGDSLLGTYSDEAQYEAQTLGPPQVLNNGSIEVNVSGGGNLGLGVWAQVTSMGSIQVDQGLLELGHFPAMPGNYSGPLTAANGTTVQIDGVAATFTTSASIDADRVSFGSPSGQPDVIAGSYRARTSTSITTPVRFTGTVLNVGGLGISGGSADFSPAAGGPVTLTLANLSIAANQYIGNGTLSGSDNFIVSGLFAWAGGTLAGPTGSTLTAQGGMTLNNNIGVGGVVVDNRTLINKGKATWTTGSVSFYAAASFTNTITGTFDDQTDGTFGSADGCCQVFNNQGTFIKSGGTGTTYLQMQLNNSGTVLVEQGTLNLGCGYVQGSGGSISGSVSGSVSNPGTYNSAPSSNPPPMLTSYTQTATGTLYEQIGGLTAGTQYGQIIVNGNVNLAGSLEVALINGFTPVYGNQFIIIDNQGTNPINGTFTNLTEGATVWDTTHTYRFTISYLGGDGNDVVLTAQQTATSTAVSASANPSVLNQAVTFTATVTPAASNGTPTGTVQFQIDNVNFGNPVALTATGTATSGSISTLAVGSHTVTAVYSGDNLFLASTGTLTETILSAQQQDALIVSQINALVSTAALSSGNGTALIAKLNSATASFNAGNATAGINQLNAFINQVTAFQKTGNLTAPQTEALISAANLAILAASGGSGAHLTNETSSSPAVSGDTLPVTNVAQLVTGVIGVYLDNSAGNITADEQARFDDALNTLDATFTGYGVDLVEVNDAASAVVQVEITGTSAAGSAADGVLGCTLAGHITLLTGWNWYTGVVTSAIGTDQYDFETIVMHELGHAIGLAHSGDTNSVMYAYLAPGQTRRGVTPQDLSVLDIDAGRTPEPLTAAPWRDRQATVADLNLLEPPQGPDPERAEMPAWAVVDFRGSGASSEQLWPGSETPATGSLAAERLDARSRAERGNQSQNLWSTTDFADAPLAGRTATLAGSDSSLWSYRNPLTVPDQDDF